MPGAAGLYRRKRPDPESFDASWCAAERHELHAELTGRDRPAALDALLTAWEEHLAPWPPDADAEAVFTWPSRDAALIPVLRGHGLTPHRVAAVRPAGRTVPRPRRAADAYVRPLGPADLDAAAALWLEELRWEAQFGACVIRASTAGNVRRRLTGALGWVAEAGGRVAGLLVVEDPRRTAWAARLAAARQPGYLTSLMVAPERRGAGLGTALVRTAHAALEEAGCTVTMLHYAALNPLSAPFWHRCGYRPLWTTWTVPRPGRLTGAPASAPPG